MRIDGCVPHTSHSPDSFPAPFGQGQGIYRMCTSVSGMGFLSGQGHVCQKLPEQFAINSCNRYQMPLTHIGKLFHCDGGVCTSLCSCNGTAQFIWIVCSWTSPSIQCPTVHGVMALCASLWHMPGPHQYGGRWGTNQGMWTWLSYSHRLKPSRKKGKLWKKINSK